MTSDEIAQTREAARDSAQGFAEADKLGLASEALNRFALLEIAYQLAVANERAEGPKKSQFWKCPSCGAILSAAAPIERPQHTCGAWMDPL